jgi:BASS family bile acid:Na+ symporter
MWGISCELRPRHLIWKSSRRNPPDQKFMQIAGTASRALALLGWLGRQGTRAVAISLLVGIALPPLAAWCRPLFVPSLFLLMCLAFLRVDPHEVRARIARPGLALVATVWVMLIVPALVGAALMLADVHQSAPGLHAALLFQVAAPPLISSAALAALMGTDAALSLVTLVIGTVITPLTATFFVALFIGPSLPISPAALGLKLIAMLAGAALVAGLLRRLVGDEAIARQAGHIDGTNVILLFIFVVALMDGVAANAIADPKLVLGLIALAFALSFGLTAVTTLLFARAGMPAALALGFGAGSRNMGLLFAAAAGALPDLAWLYLALAQIPIYLMPHMIKQIALRSSRAQ